MSAPNASNFWDSIASAHRVDDGSSADRGLLEPDPLESEPESDDDDRIDGVFSPVFLEKSGVRQYTEACRRLNVVPVQQFVSMLDQARETPRDPITVRRCPHAHAH